MASNCTGPDVHAKPPSDPTRVIHARRPAKPEGVGSANVCDTKEVRELANTAGNAAKLAVLVAVAVAMVSPLGGCNRQDIQTRSVGQVRQEQERPGDGQVVVLATSTSTYDSGLLDELLPPFEEQWGGTVKVLAVGTGQALAHGSRGDADLLMVHAPKQEEEFVAKGHGLRRLPLMYNDFVIVGPDADPAHVRDASSAAEAFQAIAAAKAVFVSRGDGSGTHTKEQAIWGDLVPAPEDDWYLSAGCNMSAALRLAEEEQGYTLSDRSTFLAQKALDLSVLCEGDPVLHNPYAVIAVSSDRSPNVNHDGAQALIDFLFSPTGKAIIAGFGREKYGTPLFHLFEDE